MLHRHGVERADFKRGRRVERLTEVERIRRERAGAATSAPDRPAEHRESITIPLDVIGRDAPPDDRARLIAEAAKDGRVLVGYPKGRGVEFKCEDCGHRPRLKKTTIYGMAAAAREHGCDEIFI